MIPLKPLLFLRAILHFIGAILRHPFGKRPATVPHETAVAREGKCSVCPHHVGSQCDLCSCFIGIKVLLSTESCPDKPKRWGEYYSPRRDGLK